MVSKMSIEDLTNEMNSIIEERSRNYNGDGLINFAYMSGFLQSELSHLLSYLNLSNEQLDMLQYHVTFLKDSVEYANKGTQNV